MASQPYKESYKGKQTMIQDLKVFVENKNKIISTAVAMMKQKYPDRTQHPEKCSRDIGYILDAFAHDIANNTNTNTVYIANKFWVRGKRQIISTEVEFIVYEWMVDYISHQLNVSEEFVALLGNLKNTLVSIIDNGSVDAPNTWNRNAQLRVNTYNWKQEAPSIDTIKEILNDLHNYSPSKQRVTRYSIEVFRNDNEEKRNKIYRAGAASTSDTARHNPQLLAPWLLFFKPRNITDDYSKTDMYMDIGIAISTIIYSAADKGIDTGLCRCVNYADLMKEAIGFFPEMTIGLGYKDPAKEYYCPHYQKMVPIPDSDHDSKPAIDEYIKYV